MPSDRVNVEPSDDRVLGTRIAFGLLGTAWISASLLDWLIHRQTKIEETAGAREASTHLLMMAEAGAPILAATLFELDAGVQALALAGFAGHQATAIWDVLYATPRRKISPLEAHTHSFLEGIPFACVAISALLSPRQFEAMVGLNDDVPRWVPRLRSGRAVAKRVLVLLGIGSVGLAPYVEEFVRCYRAHPTLGRLPIPRESPMAASHEWAYRRQAEGYEV